MIDSVLALDRQIFLFLYYVPRVPLMDHVALFLSAVGSWGGVWMIIALFLFFREEKHDHWFFLPSAIVLIGAGISEFIIKMLFARPRPTDILSTFSFPSTHALLAFAFAYILSREEPKWKYWFYLLAVLIALSRIYLGVHYPLDVVFGAMLGIIIGWFGLMLENFAPLRSIRKLPRRSKKIR